jgi:hypothetical protein
VAALDDLRVAGDDLDARRAGGGGDRVDLGAQLLGGQSLRAPDTARSLTVPLTASSPIDPPGKRSGLTT